MFCRRPGNQYQVHTPGKASAVPAEELPDEAPDANSYDGVAHLAGHRNAQAGRFQAVCEREDQKRARGELLTGTLDLQEFRPLAKPKGLGKRLFRSSGLKGQQESPIPGARYFLKDETVRRLRPLSRRRFKTARPAFVEFRFRKPWVRFRFTLDG